MGERRAHTRFWWGDPRERGRLAYPELDWWVVSKWIKAWSGFIWLRIRQKELRESAEWIDLTQDTDNWHVVVKTY
jgi:hypothetical protein